MPAAMHQARQASELHAGQQQRKQAIAVSAASHMHHLTVNHF
jgi:hypothetical protein